MALTPSDFKVGYKEHTLQDFMEWVGTGELDYPKVFLPVPTMTGLIEHILLQLPLFPCFYIQRQVDVKCIVCGSALVETLERFVGPEQFKLERVQRLPELEGLTFRELKPYLRRRIKEARWPSYYATLCGQTAPDLEVDLTQRFQGMYELFRD